MSQEYHRKATFRAVINKGHKVYTPVNKKAQYVLKQLGKRKYATPAELKASKGKGSYVFFVYTAKGLRAL